MSTFFRRITKTVPNKFRRIFSEQNSGANPTSSSPPMFLTMTQQCTDSHDWTSMECPCETKLNVFEVQSHLSKTSRPFSFFIIFLQLWINLYFDFQGAGCQQVLEKQCKVAADSKDVYCTAEPEFLNF